MLEVVSIAFEYLEYAFIDNKPSDGGFIDNVLFED